MTARCVAARRLFFSFLFSVAGLAASGASLAGCYPDGGAGTAPPPNTLYFPVGLAVSRAGNVLYAVNSDFDLQWNGGTVQSYDLFWLRHDVDELINANVGVGTGACGGAGPQPQCLSGQKPEVPPYCVPVLISPWDPCACSMPNGGSVSQSNGTRTPPNELCAPPVDSTFYQRDSVTIGAFATDLQLSVEGTRLFAPTRGSASLTWANVANDDPTIFKGPPCDPEPDAASGAAPSCPGAAIQPDGGTFQPFMIQCDRDSTGRCSAAFQAGNFVDSNDTRGVTMPGEPFAMAMTLDDTAVAITHQTTTQTSLLTTGLPARVAFSGVSPTSTGATLGAPIVSPPLGPGLSKPLVSSGSEVDAGVSADAGDATVALGAGVDGGSDADEEATSVADGGAAALDATAQGVDGSFGGAGTPVAAGSIAGGQDPSVPPSMQYVLNVTELPNGGDGLVAVPHDDSPDSPAPGCEFFQTPPPSCVRPAFLETNHTAGEIVLLRYYNDDGSSLQRPFLALERTTSLSVVQGGTDTRGIAIDPTPRIACRGAVSPAGDPCPADPTGAACQAWIACGATPSRVFIASRTPPSLIVGTMGGPSATGNGQFDPDQLSLVADVPLQVGPSNVYLAPIVNELGQYELRVFIVCFDSSEIFVYDPDTQRIENVINVGSGPFAMAFDPFNFTDVALHKAVPSDPRQQDQALKSYRFGYVAVFIDSYLQVIDLDDSLPAVSPYTFENVVFTVGQPTAPKGT
ncbi:MAG: hypothetical protein ABSC94_02085 [Polyangiaceae bacterium]